MNSSTWNELSPLVPVIGWLAKSFPVIGYYFEVVPLMTSTISLVELSKYLQVLRVSTNVYRI